MNAHPEWLAKLLAALRELWPVERTLNVVLQEDHFWEFYGQPTADGLCQILPDLIQIHIRASSEDTEYWRDVVCHEYAHACLASLTEVTDPSPEYVAMVELLVARLAGLLDFAVRMGAERRLP
jgi:hypothetical protein